MPSRAARSSRRRASATPSLPIVARAHSEAEIEHLKKHGATAVVMGEHEIAKAMIAAIPPAAPPAGFGDAGAEPAGRAGVQRTEHRGDTLV